MHTKIKITSFERQNLNKPELQPHNKQSQLSLNFILFTPNKKLGFAQKIIKQKQQQRNDIGFTKAINISGLSYAMESCPISVPVFCIFDQELNQEIIQIFTSNQKAVAKRQLFSLAILIQKFDQLPKQYYHIEGIDLITCKQQKISEFIEKGLDTKPNLGSYISSSSLNSNDFQEIQNRFEFDQNKKQLIDNSDTNQQKQVGYAEKSPGYKYNREDALNDSRGTYNAKGVKFSRAGKKIDVAQWKNSKSTFSKLEQL